MKVILNDELAKRIYYSILSMGCIFFITAVLMRDLLIIPFGIYHMFLAISMLIFIIPYTTTKKIWMPCKLANYIFWITLLIMFISGLYGLIFKESYILLFAIYHYILAVLQIFFIAPHTTNF